MDEDKKSAPQFSEERWTSILNAMMDRARGKAGPQVLVSIPLLASKEQLRIVQEAWSQLVVTLHEVAEEPERQTGKFYQFIDEVDAGLANIFAMLRDL